MLALYVHLSTYLDALADGIGGRARGGRHDERGQASAEYALVLLGAAAVALLIVAWATKTNLIGKLLDAVMGAITDKVK
jgi:Flp pilus assembly pilin Flp